MPARTTTNMKVFSLSGFIISLCLGIFFSPVTMANDADWGQVKRFNEQLEQAKNGKVSAMYEVGRLYERGRGTDKSLTTAANWYEKASNAGHHSAKARLGKMYLEGRGVKKNLAKASRLITSAARNNVSGAQYQLGLMYEIGIGRSQDVSKALYWYKKAAALGHYQAERKARQLKNANASPFIASPAPAVAKPQTKKTLTKAKAKPKSSNTIESIAKGSWQRRKKPSGYLPSSINNCNVTGGKTIKCVSSEQERSTGSEIITFSTESTITASAKNKFVVEYVNNVLEVEVLQAEDVSGVEDEEATAASKTSIHKGKQAKVHKLNCTLDNSKSITCIKGGIRTLKFTR